MGSTDRPPPPTPSPPAAGPGAPRVYRSVFEPFQLDAADDAALRRRRKVVRRGVRLLRAVFGDRPAPLAFWRALRRLARRGAPAVDALTFRRRRYVRRVSLVDDPELRALLAGEALGDFALDARAVNLVWRRFEAERPTAVLQCGAGATTLTLAYLARRRRFAGARCIVVALDEATPVRDALKARLERDGLADFAHVLHAPLDAEGRYRFDPSEVARLGGGAFDWVVVEGPIAANGRPARVLPDVAPLCADGAAWFIDDAFRDAQFDLLEAWARTPGIEVRGIHALVGKGLATGRLRRSKR